MLDKLIELKGTSTYKYEDDILYYQASEVKFLPKERNVTVTVSVDGEPIGILPAIFKSYHNALTIKTETHSSKIQIIFELTHELYGIGEVKEKANVCRIESG